MQLHQVTKALQFRITGGSEYLWNCYPDGRYLDFTSEFATASVIFNPNNHNIYEATVEPKDNRPYRWINPHYRTAVELEATSRGVDKNEAWDDVMWIDLETEDDFLEKAEAIFSGADFDRRIQVPLTLNNDEMLQLAMLAHDQDITLNQLVVNILSDAIERKSNE